MKIVSAFIKSRLYCHFTTKEFLFSFFFENTKFSLILCNVEKCLSKINQHLFLVFQLTHDTQTIPHEALSLKRTREEMRRHLLA